VKLKIIYILLYSFISILSLRAFADDSSKVYLSTGILNWDTITLDHLSNVAKSHDEYNLTSKMTLGYKVSPKFSIEGSLITPLDYSANLTDSHGDVNINGKSYCVHGSSTVKLDLNTTYLLGVKYSSSNDVPLIINITVGQMFWDFDYSVDVGSGYFSYNGTNYTNQGVFDSNNGNDPYFGFGASYKLNNNSSFDLDLFSSNIGHDSVYGHSISYSRRF